jgi:adenine-specific DNA-methyltransferase
MIRPGDSAALRKERGAFFTPPDIADYLATWAVQDDPAARVLDPTCGEAVFLLAAGRRLRALGRDAGELDQNLFGVDLHQASLDRASALLAAEGAGARLRQGDFFDVETPDRAGSPLPRMDAVIGNPPFVRYHRHVGEARATSRRVALQQGVRLSGFASSWAALLVHAAGFLKPDGRLAMVLPTELLTVGYAEPVRAWLRQRFEQVHLVLFDKLQFRDATEKVVLVLASGGGGPEIFSVESLDTADNLTKIRPRANLRVSPGHGGKWTDLLLPEEHRLLFKSVSAEHFTPLLTYGRPELGTVTGANNYFTLSERTRAEHELAETEHVVRICPPGTKHLRGSCFTTSHWEGLRDAGERVWLLRPDHSRPSAALLNYLALGRQQRVPEAYKCTVRTPWWRPPVVLAPDLFFTYMSHRFPRLIRNGAGVSFVNSMHGIRLARGATDEVTAALPLLALNSVTLLGAEIFGRSYGGGILKMEPREAGLLPLPRSEALIAAWARLEPRAALLDGWLREGRWSEVVEQVDQVLLRGVIGLGPEQLGRFQEAVARLRSHRLP